MSSSQAYLGSFESTDQVRVTVSKEIIDSFLSSVNMEDITISSEQWNLIWKAIYESDLVSDFFEGIIEIATDVVEGK
jgi:hypothetical protein